MIRPPTSLSACPAHPPAFPFGRLASLLLTLLLLQCVLFGAASGEKTPLAITDALGRSVVFKSTPTRIVSLSPSNTEAVFALGAGEKVVGVTTFCDYPAAALAITKIGGFSARTINIEAIVALKPDLVLCGDQGHLPVIETLERLGIPVVSVKVRNFEDLYAHILQLGDILDRQEKARLLVDDIRRRVAAISQRVAGIPQDKKVCVYWEVFDEPLMSCGPRSIIGQLITLAGGRNIFDDLTDEFPQVSAEAVITRDPELIMGPELMRARSLTLERVRSRPGWSGIKAVREARLVILPDDAVARPGPRLVEGLALIAKALYPELFKEPVQ